jgi:hypothetical protein
MGKNTGEWKKVYYGDEDFKFWSDTLTIFGDRRLEEEAPMEDWRIIVIFSPKSFSGSLAVKFFVGFLLPSGLAKIFTVPRKLADGMFAMRIGPGDCHFFVASNEDKFSLEEFTLVEKDEFEQNEKFSQIPLY